MPTTSRFHTQCPQPAGSTSNVHNPQVQTDFIIRLEKSPRISLSAQTKGLYYSTYCSTNVDGHAIGADLEIRATLSAGFGNPPEPGEVACPIVTIHILPLPMFRRISKSACDIRCGSPDPHCL